MWISSSTAFVNGGGRRSWSGVTEGTIWCEAVEARTLQLSPGVVAATRLVVLARNSPQRECSSV